MFLMKWFLFCFVYFDHLGTGQFPVPYGSMQYTVFLNVALPVATYL